MNGSGSLNTCGVQSLEEFSQQLDASGSDYLLVAEDRERRCVDIRFMGPFQGKDVIWNVRLLALGSSPDNTVTQKQFIEVRPRDTFDYDLRVGLAVPDIDRATILKAIIMIRKYKRLHIGYHEFGPEPL